MNETRRQRRARLAEMLTDETGHKVRDMNSCYGLWDEAISYFWTPLYSLQDVRRKAEQIARRTREETLEMKAAVLNAASEDEENRERMKRVRAARHR